MVLQGIVGPTQFHSFVAHPSLSGDSTDENGLDGGPVNTDFSFFYNGIATSSGEYFASHESFYVQQTVSTTHRPSAASDKLSVANSISYPFDQYSFNTSLALRLPANVTANILRAGIASTPQGVSVPPALKTHLILEQDGIWNTLLSLPFPILVPISKVKAWYFTSRSSAALSSLSLPSR